MIIISNSSLYLLLSQSIYGYLILTLKKHPIGCFLVLITALIGYAFTE